MTVHRKGAMDAKTRKEPSSKDSSFACLGVLCVLAVQALSAGRLQEYKKPYVPPCEVRGRARENETRFTLPQSRRASHLSFFQA